MRVSVCIFLLATVECVVYGQQAVPRMTSSGTVKGERGGVVSFIGENLQKELVARVILTDGRNDFPAEIVEQTATTIEFRVPETTDPGRFAVMILTRGRDSKYILQRFWVRIDRSGAFQVEDSYKAPDPSQVGKETTHKTDTAASEQERVEPPHTIAARTNAGPFGFEYGMKKEEVFRLVGRGAVKEEKEDILELATAPKPHPAFESYALIISPEQGLLKIIAIGRDIATNGFGAEVSDAFIEIRAAVSTAYGKPETFDFLKAGSIWNEPRDWMTGLLKTERVLSAFWNARSTNHITGIELEAKALSSDKGYLSLRYEFDGWGKYLDSKKAKAGTVF